MRRRQRRRWQWRAVIPYPINGEDSVGSAAWCAQGSVSGGAPPSPTPPPCHLHVRVQSPTTTVNTASDGQLPQA